MLMKMASVIPAMSLRKKSRRYLRFVKTSRPSFLGLMARLSTGTTVGAPGEFDLGCGNSGRSNDVTMAFPHPWWFVEVYDGWLRMTRCSVCDFMCGGRTRTLVCDDDGGEERVHVLITE